MALVNKRLSGLCLAPQLQNLRVSIRSEDSSAVVQRARSLLGLFTAHARHVRSLDLHVDLPRDAQSRQWMEVAALVTGCLTACGTAGGALELLAVSSSTPLASTAWLCGLSSLQKLDGMGEQPPALHLLWWPAHRCPAPLVQP